MTAAAIGGATPPKLEMGKVISATLRVLAVRSLDLFIIGLPFVFLPNLLAALLPPDFKTVSLVFGLPSLVFIGGASLLAYREITGGPRVGVGEAISAGVRKFGSLWGVGLISNIGTAIGLLLLIAPGVVLASSLAAASSAVMVENATTTAAIERAWSLSQGSRWRLAGLVLIALLAVIVLLLPLIVVTAILAIALGQETGGMIAEVLIVPLYTVLAVAMTTVGSTAVYTGLRQAREGAVDVAEVFV
jgi:hypothetical protein